MPRLINERQLKVADVTHLQEHQACLTEKLANARTTKMGAKLMQAVGITTAALQITPLVEHSATTEITSAGTALAFAAIWNCVDRYTEKLEIVYDLNLASIEAEIEQRSA